MPNYYKTATGFSYFQLPDKLMELRPQLQDFAFDFWLLVHHKIQHNTHSPSIQIPDELIASHSFWGGRKINSKEISRARAELKKFGLLWYVKEGQTWRYFCVNPVTGITIDPAEAARQVADMRGNKRTERTELSKVRAELAALKEQMASQVQIPQSAPGVIKPPVKREYIDDRYADTGAVEEDSFIQ